MERERGRGGGGGVQDDQRSGQPPLHKGHPSHQKQVIQRLGIYSDLHICLIYVIHVISRQDEDEEKKEKKQLGRETRICFWSQVHCFATSPRSIAL